MRNAVFILLSTLCCTSSSADVIRWDTGATIPGTAGIVVGPGFTFGGNLAFADLSGADLAGTKLSDANLSHSDLSEAHFRNATLRSTDLSNANLRNASFYDANLAFANLSGANLKGAEFHFHHVGLLGATFDSNTIYNQWTKFPNSFDPTAAGATYFHQPKGDFDSNDSLDVADVEYLSRYICCVKYHNDGERLDLNTDSFIDREDLRVWIEELKQTDFGDVNLDGTVTFDDFLSLSHNFGKPGTWGNGDFNADRAVDFGDFLILSANFGKSPSGLVAVPEPCASTMAAILLTALMPVARLRSVRRLL